MITPEEHEARRLVVERGRQGVTECPIDGCGQPLMYMCIYPIGASYSCFEHGEIALLFWGRDDEELYLSGDEESEDEESEDDLDDDRDLAPGRSLGPIEDSIERSPGAGSAPDEGASPPTVQDRGDDDDER